MNEELTKKVVFFVLVIIIALSALGSWRVITMHVSEGSETNNDVFPENDKSSGYVSIQINQEEENNG